MSCPSSIVSDETRRAGFVRSDLCAQLAPLDRYGLSGVSAALVDGILALAGRRISHRPVMAARDN